jgi:hypothetical protein
VKKTAGTVPHLAAISGLNPGPLMDADGTLMEQPSAPVVDLALGWAKRRFRATNDSFHLKINNHHSTIINPSRALRSVSLCVLCDFAVRLQPLKLLDHQKNQYFLECRVPIDPTSE